ncbi:MAG: prepilin-type N-terminal cleavage/methylation domain-containing protein [Bacilli bacterium]|nr:prepilin-type N-terminal cleavage/methylation domain-containing protein [Bacilli bacterium]
MKNKGFTLVEIIVSFALTMIVVLFLFQLIITLKGVYTNNFVASNLVLKQANISKMINNDLLAHNLGRFREYNYDQLNKCYVLLFSSGITHSICADTINNNIIYDGYVFDLIKGSKVGEVSVKIKNTNDLYIHIPITYPDLDKDYGIKIALVNN